MLIPDDQSGVQSENGPKPLQNPLTPLLAQQGYAVIDGALATELERRGADLRDRLWSAKLLIEAPQLIKRVHLDYLEAGADVLITSSYQATLAGFMERGLGRDAACGLIRLSVELALKAREEYWAVVENRGGRNRPLVAASVGPYGAYLADGSEYRGDYGQTEHELIEFHRPQVEILAASQADLLAFETIPSLIEGRALIRLLSKFPDKTAWIAFSCSDGHHVSSGDSFDACAALAETSAQIVAVGANCTAPRHIQSLICDARAVTAKPVIVYPNSGEGWDSASGAWIAEGDRCSIASFAQVWNSAGARLIGGCCRTTPEDIAALRAAMTSVL